MEALKIGIVEDDLLIAESIAVTLQQIGYLPTRPVRTVVDALEMIKNEGPDLVLIDIVLAGEQDGIELAEAINRDFGIPFIFLTANSDAATVNRAKKVNPYAYLVKPFSENDLYSSIEVAFSNYNKSNSSQSENAEPVAYLKDILFIKEGELFHKIEINDILYVESDNVYLSVYTAKKHFVVRAKLDDFIAGFAKEPFVRVHRSYAINLKHLETINSLSVKVAGREVPLHKVYRQELLKLVNAVK